MDVRLSAEQATLRDSAVQIVERLGPTSVRQLEDTERRAKLDAAVETSGWRELRTAAEDGTPWASAVEAALVGEELGRGLADTPFLGPTLAAELRRLAGAPPADRRETVVLGGGFSELAHAERETLGPSAVAVDAEGAAVALLLLPAVDGTALGSVAVDELARGVDLTRPVATWAGPPKIEPVRDQARVLDLDDLERWRSLGLALTCADLVGVTRGALAMTVEYAKTRRQYDAPIGSFQAVQHLLADACVAAEGSRSVALHAAWAVDALAPADALAAASVAKAYCARAARSVCETAIQVHGGIGNTWDCLAHVFLRRALLSTEILGGVGDSLERVLVAHGAGVDDGLR